MNYILCNEMLAQVKSTMKEENAQGGKGMLYFRINYLDLLGYYYETTNKRDLSFEGLFGSIGGLIGIFMGYSLYHVVELAIVGSSLFKRILSNKCSEN